MRKFEFLEKARSIHGYKYNYPDLPDKITLNDKVRIEYFSEIYIQSVSKHLMGRCPEKTIKKKTTDEFILESKLIWGNKYDYSLTEYTGALSTVKIIHKGILYQQRASSHLLGLAPEFRNNEESSLRKKIEESDKFGISEIRDFLKKYGFDFEENKEINGLFFQFYLPRIRTILEYNSQEHYLIKELDKLKENYCEESYINLITIKYDQKDNIYHILYNNLKNYINKV